MISIIAILSGIMLFTMGGVRDNKLELMCASNLRQIGQGIALYAADHGGHGPSPRNEGESGWTSTFYYDLWPYVMDHDRDGRTGSTASVQATSRINNPFICPSSQTNPVSTPNATRIFNEANGNWYMYTINMDANRGFGFPDFNTIANSSVPLHRLPDPSRTVAVAETSFWYTNAGWYHNRDGFIPHRGGANFLFYDGHVEHYMYEDIPPDNSSVFWSGIPDDD